MDVVEFMETRKTYRQTNTDTNKQTEINYNNSIHVHPTYLKSLQ